MTRDHQEIIAEILKSARVSQGISKTRIMYEVQLSFLQLKEYLKYLQQLTKKTEYTELQQKEKKFLELHSKITELTSEIKNSRQEEEQ